MKVIKLVSYRNERPLKSFLHTCIEIDLIYTHCLSHHCHGNRFLPTFSVSLGQIFSLEPQIHKSNYLLDLYLFLSKSITLLISLSIVECICIFLSLPPSPLYFWPRPSSGPVIGDPLPLQGSQAIICSHCLLPLLLYYLILLKI